MKNIFYACFLALLIISCKSKQREKQEKEVSVLIQKLNRLKDSVNANKMDSLLEMRLAATTLLIRVKTTYAPKKIDLVFGKTVENFKQLQRQLKEKKKNGNRNLPGDYVLINKLIQEEESALEKLKSDIQFGRGEKEKYDEYILFERQKMSTIVKLYQQYLKEKKIFIPKFHKGYKELENALSTWEKENLVKRTIQ